MNESIKFLRRNKIKTKGRDKSPPSNAIARLFFDAIHPDKAHDHPKNKPLNRKERKRHRNHKLKLRPVKTNDQQTILACYLIHMNYMDTFSNKPSMHTPLRKVKRQRISLNSSLQSWIEQGWIEQVKLRRWT
jgi:hypothetical protein